MAFSSECSFTCHTYCDMEPLFLKLYPKDPWFSLLNAVLLAKEQSLFNLNVLGLKRPARVGIHLTISRMLSKSTNTRLRKPFSKPLIHFVCSSSTWFWESASQILTLIYYCHHMLYTLVCKSLTIFYLYSHVITW
jgi:hypothetical protein